MKLRGSQVIRLCNYAPEERAWGDLLKTKMSCFRPCTRTKHLPFLLSIVLFVCITSQKSVLSQQHQNTWANYVYLFNDTRNVSEATTNETSLPIAVCVTSNIENCSQVHKFPLEHKISERPISDNDLGSDDHETSASMLKLSHQEVQGHNNKKAHQDVEQQKQPAAVRKKLTRLFGRPPSPSSTSGGAASNKKISIQALLPKGKRQDSPTPKGNTITQPSRGLPAVRPDFISRLPAQQQQPHHHMLMDEGFTPMNHRPFYRMPPLTRTSPVEQSFFDQSAAQSIENYQRIQLNKHQSDPSVYFASTSPGNGGLPNQSGRMHQPSVLGTTTAGNLLGERAKELMSFINLNPAHQQQQAHHHHQQQQQLQGQPTSGNHRAGGNLRASSSNLNGLASMIKSAAEAWASSTTANDATPTIILEHDGPSITTVDFNNNNLQRPPVLEDEQPDEPEENDDFYSQEVEQTESEGSQNHNKRSRARGFGNQPVNSQNIQSELPPGEGVSSAFYGEAGTTAGDLAEDELLQELLQNRAKLGRKQTRQLYPDSINAAIREQQRYGNRNNNDNNHNEVESRRRNKDNNDQLDRLIRELQDIKEKSKRGDDSEVNEKIRSFLDSNDDELRDKSRDTDGDNDDMQYDEQTARLRRKLLAKLKAKGDKRKFEKAASSSDGSSFQGGEVKIPLHALLMAALDRRMSPSEKTTQTVSLDSELIVDDRNKGVVADTKQDFDDISSNLGSLMDGNNLYESMLAQANGDNATKPIEGLNFTTTTTPSPLAQPSMFILNNFGAGSETSTQLANATTSSNNSTSSDEVESPANQDNDEFSLSATTRMPSRAGRNRKERRDLSGNGNTDEGDFDVTRQVDDFASDDDNEQQLLEPVYMRDDEPGSKGRRGRRPGNSVEFDDEQDESEESSRRRRPVKRRRRRPAAKLDEATYERQGDKFLDRVHRDTDNNEATAELEQNTSGIDDPITAGSVSSEDERAPAWTTSERGKRKRQRNRRNRRREDGEEDGDDDPEDIDKPSVTTTSDPEDPDNSEESQSRRPEESRNVEERRWRPETVDDEVRRIELQAQANLRSRSRSQARHMPDGADGFEEGESDEGEASESRYSRSTLPPEKPLLRVTIDSSGGNIETFATAGSESVPTGNSTFRIVEPAKVRKS